MSDFSDSQLLQDYHRQRSEGAFAEVVRRHVNLVYSVALRQVGIAAWAEEITQTVFVILAREAGRLHPSAVLEGWLCKTARLTALGFLRGERRRQAREQEVYMRSTAEDSAEDSVWNQLSPLLDEALSRLGAKDRDAVVLRYFKGQSVRDVAAGLKVTEAAAQRRVSRAVEKMRLYFAKRGLVQSTEALTAIIFAHSIQAAPLALAKTATAAGLAHGAAVGASAWIFLKWALKTKTAAVATVATVLGIGAIIFFGHGIYRDRLTAQHDIRGAWEGVFQVASDGIKQGEATTSRLVLTLFKENGNYRAMADAIDLGLNHIPVTVDYRYPSVRFVVNPQIEFQGTVSPNGTELDFDGLALHRTTTPDAPLDKLTENEFTPRPDADLQGYWEGTIGAGENALPLSWKIARQADGTYRAELDNPNQGALDQPAKVIYNHPRAKLILASNSGMFEGEISYDNTELKGLWIQGGKPIPANFIRGDYQAERQLDTLRDYSFHSDTDLQGHWEGTFLLSQHPKFPVRLALDIGKLPDGTFSVAVASLYHLGNNRPRPASSFKYVAPNVDIGWKWMGDRFQGKLRNGKISGAWTAGNARFPLVFERQHRENLTQN